MQAADDHPIPFGIRHRQGEAVVAARVAEGIKAHDTTMLQVSLSSTLQLPCQQINLVCLLHRLLHLGHVMVEHCFQITFTAAEQ